MNSNIDLSVIICTHNPRPEYIKRVLNALENQTLSKHKWELLVIDNASSSLFVKELDLSWHPYGQYVREEQLGLLHARLRGIKETKADLLVFVDDDNILYPDYLELVLQIAQDCKWSIIGAWGGQCIPEFEEPPDEKTMPWWGLLAIREFEKDVWTNKGDALPCGAGMCIRRIVAEQYAEIVKSNPEKIKLGRKGKELSGNEDNDMALTTSILELGTALFTSLKLIHLMPASRLKEDYLLNLMEETVYSAALVDAYWGKLKLPSTTLRSLLAKIARRSLLSSHLRRFHDAGERGRIRAFKELNLYRNKK